MTALETIAAYPVGADADKALQRALLTTRFMWVLAASEDLRNFTVDDPADGKRPLYIVQNNIVFAFDSTDTTTAHDGVTCIISGDATAHRYKATGSVQLPYSVLNSTTTAQPVSPAPAIGDKYRVPAAATGTDWAGQDGKIAVYTARGWVFIVAPIGWLLHDEAGECFYHKDASGTWTLGFGNQAFSAGSIYPSMMSGGGGKVRWYVENQTTNAPPGSPVDLVEYIIGSSPTGAWSGKAKQVARYENAAWTYYVPAAGWRAYDKSTATNYEYNGTAWVASAGAWQKLTGPVLTTSGSTSLTGSSYADYSTTVAPTTSSVRVSDNATISHTAIAAGAKLRLRYSCGLIYGTDVDGTTSGTTTHLQIAVFRDSEVNAIAWRKFAVKGSFEPLTLDVEFHFTAPDALAHTYKIGLIAATDASDAYTATPARRSLTIEEAAA